MKLGTTCASLIRAVTRKPIRSFAVLAAAAALGTAGLAVAVTGIADAQTTPTADCTVTSNGGNSFTATGHASNFAAEATFTWSGAATGTGTQITFSASSSGTVTVTATQSSSPPTQTASGSCSFTVAATPPPAPLVAPAHFTG